MEGGLVKLPPNIDLQGANVSTEWKFWKTTFEDYLVATGHDQSLDKVKLSLLRNMMGSDAARLVSTLPLSDHESKEYDSVIKAIDNFVSPRVNVVFERYIFNARCQKEGEPFEQFFTDCRRLVKNCDYSGTENTDSIENQLLRDKIVHGICDKRAQEALLRLDNLTLDKAAQFCRTNEQSKIQAEQLNRSVMVDAASRSKREMFVSEEIKGKPRTKVESKLREKSPKKNSDLFDCQRCQSRHGLRQCPAFGKRCRNCNRYNHFAVSCRARRPVKSVETRSGASSDSEESKVGLMPVKCFVPANKSKNDDYSRSNLKFKIQSIETSGWYEDIKIENTVVKCKLDSGADVSVMPLNIFKKLNKDNKYVPTPINILLERFDNTTIRPIGVVRLLCEYNSKKSAQDFMIVEDSAMLLGLPGCLALNLIKRIHQVKDNEAKQNFVERNPEVFKGYGKFPTECNIPTKPGCDEIFWPPSKIPNCLLEPLKLELDRLVERNAIVKVDQVEPSACINKVVIVEKPNNKIRLCLDPRDLNKFIVRKPKQMPSLDEISSKLSGKSFYSVFDLSEGFHHIPLNESSSWKCCFATPFGVYRYVVLPFGLCNAPELFQDEVEHYFGDLKNIMIWFDDICVYGDSEEEHDTAVTKLVERAKRVGAVFNAGKLQYKLSRVKYVGQIFDKSGMKLDPDRIETLQKLKAPTNKEELQRIIGSFNYVRKYVPEMAELMAPLCKLLKKNVEWHWLPHHEEIFNKLKTKVTEAPALTPFDPCKNIVLQWDSSKNSIGSCMFQDHNGVLKLVACVSRTMNDCELNYSQTEKELLSIYFGTQKFHQFIYGVPIVVQTDHRPLLSIMKKHVSKIGSVRLQRLRLKLLKYQITLEYVPGKQLHFADMLSRNSLKEIDHDVEMLEMVHTVSRHLHMSTKRKSELQSETVKDTVLSKVMEYVKVGWPEDGKLKYDNELKLYSKLKDDLYIEAGVLFYGSKIVVPKKLRQSILYKLHKGHIGTNKMVIEARNLYYWPKLNSDIADWIKHCRICEKHAPFDFKEPLLSHKIPNQRFSKVGTDILEFQGKFYLVLVDYFSHWTEILNIRDKTSSQVINALQDVFCRFGYPVELVADHVPFSSIECRKYFESKDIMLLNSTPHYPQSNGMAEKAVGIGKKLLKKSTDEGSDFREALLHYNNSPLTGIGVSPSQILNSRRCRTTLPVSGEALKPEIQNVYKQLFLQQKITEARHDSHARKKEKVYKKGDKIVFRTAHDSYWQKATVVRKAKEPRSYWVIREGSNKPVRRNTTQMKESFTNSRFNDNESDVELLILTDNLNSNCTRGGLESSRAQNAGQRRALENTQQITRSGRKIKPPQRLNL